MAPTTHIVSSYESELRDLDSKIAHMGGMTEQLLANGFDALVKRDPALAERVIASDQMVDTYNREIEERAITTIATLPLRSASVARTAASDTASSAEVGSSRISSSGSPASARAMARRCR